MSDARAQMLEDRALRDASLALVKADIAHLKANLAGKSLSERVISRVGNSAAEVFDEAVEVADSNRGVLATLIAAVFLWFARNPIMALFDEEASVEDGFDNAAVHQTDTADG